MITNLYQEDGKKGLQAGAELCQAQVPSQKLQLKLKRKPGFEAVDDTV